MFFILTNLLLPLLLYSNATLCQKHDLSTPSSIINERACNVSTTGFRRIAVSCNFSTNDYTIDANSMPSNVDDFEILAGGNIVFDARAFSRLRFLGRVHVQNVASLILRRESFLNLSTNHLRLEVINIVNVEVESKSFYLLKGPVTYEIFRCSYVIVHSDAVPWIQSLNISDVKHLKLSENSLSQASEKNVHYHQGYNTKIVMQNVTLGELPTHSFPSPAAEIKLHECNVQTVRKNAFSAVELYTVIIQNSIFNVLETEAFSERSLLRSLQLVNVNIGQMRTGAILSAVTNFSISNSNVHLIEQEAFNMSTMVHVRFLNNVFLHIKGKGITLRSWMQAIIENNTLRDLDNNAINVPYQEGLADPRTLRFAGNILQGLKEYSLQLNTDNAAEFVVQENIVIEDCRCYWRNYLETIIRGSDRFVDSMYNGSYCTVNPVLATCFRYPERFMRATNFTEHMCNARDTIVCSQHPETKSTENPNIVKAISILNEQKENQERKVVSAVIAIALLGVFVTTLLSLCVWFNRKSKYQTECFLPSIGNFLLSVFSRLIISRNMGRTTSAHSITRVSVHEYAEVGPHKLLPNEIEENIYVCEDKATQTLPEELTQELLQSLREKLDDPENYTEARNMIEHLYDLIKVEECCNNNVLTEEFGGEINLGNNEGVNENVYDVIKPDTKQRIRRYDKSFKTLAHKGTRVPSPDKLLPLTFTTSSFPNSARHSLRNIKPLITEYMEPSDRQSYIYSELLYDQSRPKPDRVEYNSTLDMLTEYKQPNDFKIPVYSELTGIIHRPLPIAPTVVNDSRESLTTLESLKTQS